MYCFACVRQSWFQLFIHIVSDSAELEKSTAQNAASEAKLAKVTRVAAATGAKSASKLAKAADAFALDVNAGVDVAIHDRLHMDLDDAERLIAAHVRMFVFLLLGVFLRSCICLIVCDIYFFVFVFRKW